VFEGIAGEDAVAGTGPSSTNPCSSELSCTANSCTITRSL